MDAQQISAMYRVIHHQSRQEQAESCYLAYCVSAKISSTLRDRIILLQLHNYPSYQQFWLLFGGCGKWDTEKGGGTHQRNSVAVWMQEQLQHWRKT